MSSDELRWDARHAAGTHDRGIEPTPFLREHLDLIPRGPAVDLACGTGRNALFLAREGFDVLAVDVSGEALARLEERAAAAGLSVATTRRDLSADGVPAGRWDLVVVTYFLDRALFGPIRSAIAAGGVLVYETYTVQHAERTGFNRRYCLEPGELLSAFAGMRVVAYREGDVASLLAFDVTID
jgi:SAM-dependent methyltransferase